ncbi:MAG: hypothetical protein Q9159_004631 [Coniocarpon cinnabarinum]
MAAVSAGDIISITKEVYSIYKAIKDSREQIQSAVDETEELTQWTARLKSILDEQESTLQKDSPTEHMALTALLKKIQTDVVDVRDIFEEYLNRGRAARFMWPSTSAPETLVKLGSRIDKRRGKVGDWIRLLELKFHEHVRQTQTQQYQILLDLQRRLSQGPKASVPHPKMILFLDNHDNNRAVVGSFYARLLYDWTISTGNYWPLKFPHSAGVHLEGTGAIASAQKIAKVHQSAEKLGGKPEKAAIDALFQKAAGIKNKRKLWDEAITHTARPLRDDYSKYDYIIVFDDYIRRGFEKVNEQMRKTENTKKWNGKLIALPVYHRDAHVREISRTKLDGSDAQKWDIMTDQIKGAFQEFLKQELGWKRPQT